MPPSLVPLIVVILVLSDANHLFLTQNEETGEYAIGDEGAYLIQPTAPLFNGTFHVVRPVAELKEDDREFPVRRGRISIDSRATSIRFRLTGFYFVFTRPGIPLFVDNVPVKTALPGRHVVLACDGQRLQTRLDKRVRLGAVFLQGLDNPADSWDLCPRRRMAVEPSVVLRAARECSLPRNQTLGSPAGWKPVLVLLSLLNRDRVFASKEFVLSVEAGLYGTLQWCNKETLQVEHECVNENWFRVMLCQALGSQLTHFLRQFLDSSGQWLPRTRDYVDELLKGITAGGAIEWLFDSLNRAVDCA